MTMGRGQPEGTWTRTTSKITGAWSVRKDRRKRCGT